MTRIIVLKKISETFDNSINERGTKDDKETLIYARKLARGKGKAWP